MKTGEPAIDYSPCSIADDDKANDVPGKVYHSKKYHNISGENIYPFTYFISCTS